MVSNLLMTEHTEGRSNQMLVSVVGLLYVAWHVATLSVSPLPWYDEVFFAGISQNVAAGKGFYTLPTLEKQPYEALFYGPLYFWLQAFVIKLAGLHQFTFRLTGLLSGIACLAIVYRYAAGTRSKWHLAAVLLLMFAPQFIQSMHNGRMDMLANALLLLAYLPVLRQQSLTTHRAAFSAMLFALALLTTPRAATLFPGFFVYYLAVEPPRIPMILCLFATAALPLLAFGTWSTLAAGSPLGAMATMQHHEASAVSFVGISWVRSLPDDLLLWLFIAAAAWQLYRRRDTLLLALLVTCISFCLLVRENGPYINMVLPFAALGLARWWQLQQPGSILYFRMTTLAGLTLAVFACVFVFKNAVIASTLQGRLPHTFNQWARQYLKPGDKVLADAAYYYAVNSAGAGYCSLTPHHLQRQPAAPDQFGINAVVTDLRNTIIIGQLGQTGFASSGSFPARIPELLAGLTFMNWGVRNPGYNAIVLRRAAAVPAQ
jgi:4-amino-4-deoxy-L-arabinose transferase-like glycosyltransferase